MLKGLKIIDFTRYFPGPQASQRLRQLGADVVKVEDVKGGDLCRAVNRLNGEEGVEFRFFNWGKESVACDMKTPEGKAAVLELIKDADVLMESFKPGVMTRLGLDYETVSRINPRIVYLSISGYGQNSYLAKQAGHDLNYAAMAGLLDQFKDSSGKPITFGIPLADSLTSLVSNELILAGVIKAKTEGKGSYIDLSMTEAAMSIMGMHIAHESVYHNELTIFSGICKGVYETSDGRYMVLHACEPKFFKNFCEAAGVPELFEHQMSKPTEDNPYFHQMETLFKSRSFAQWREFSEEVDCCLTPILHAGELRDAKHVQERGMIENCWNMDLVKFFYNDGQPYQFSEKPYPLLGESNKCYNFI